jgi:outer membrane protein TolC
VGVFGQHLHQDSVPFLPESQFSYGLNVKWTIWDFNQRGEAVAERRAQARQAHIRLDHLRRTVRGDVEKAYREVVRAQALVETTREARALREEAARLARDQVAAGVVLATAASDAETASIASAADLLQAELGLRTAAKVLAKVSGTMN